MRKLLSFISLVLLLAACKPGKEVKNEVFNLPAVEDIAMYSDYSTNGTYCQYAPNVL